MSADLQHRRIYAIASQHLDVAYLWKRRPDGEELMHQCFERAVEMLEAHPDLHFVFSRSTAWSFAAVEREYPELFARVKQYVAEDRIEVCGGQWVEPDNLIPAGETLVRQNLYGQRYFQQTFGKKARVSWNPDAFVHGHTLPQLLVKSGLEGYYFHRCQPADEEGESITQFVWEGLDGSRVLVFAGSWRGRPDRAVLEECAAGMERAGLPAGFVVTGANSDRRVTMETDWVPLVAQASREGGLPEARWASASEVLEAMQEYADRLPVVTGELGFQFSGTYTTEGNIKRHNRRLEGLLDQAEKLHAWAALLGNEYPEARLGQVWRDFCVNNFHDIICGTCYQHVHEEALALFREIEERTLQLRTEALQAIASQVEVEPGPEGSEPLLVFNALSWDRRTPVAIPDAGHQEILTRDGRTIPAQPVQAADGSQELVFVPPEVPALCFSIFYPKKATSAPAAASGKEFRLENRFLRADVDPENGELLSLVDSASGEELLAEGGPGNRLVFYGDRTDQANYEPWYIGYTGEVADPGTVGTGRRLEAGPVRSLIRVERQVRLSEKLPPTRIVQDLILYEELPYLIVQMRGDWQAEAILLKAEFDLSFRCERIVCDMPYGIAERPPHLGEATFRIGRDAAGEDGMEAGTLVQEPDRPMHKWLDFADGTRGLAFLNDGKYGYDAAACRVRLSLMRAPTHRDGERVGLGPFSFRYALLPHRGDWRAARLPQRGFEFNQDLIARCTGAQAGFPLAGKSLFGVRDPEVLIAAVKQGEDGNGLILRLYESSGRSMTTRLTALARIADMCECSLIEEPAASGDCRQISARQVEIAMKPFEVKTLRLRLERLR